MYIGNTSAAFPEPALATILSPRHFVEVRTTLGGPAPSETRRALGVSKELLATDESWLRTTRKKLEAAANELKAATSAL